jgi:hypothetical protein
MGYEVLICCYFDQEDDVGVQKKLHYSVRLFLTKQVFVVNFCKNSLADAAC